MKKLLALVLALVMSMSLVTISNAAFKDADKIDYKEAVDVMNAVGVFIGDEKGNFNAKENLTREQAAKIIAYLELGEKAADALVGSATFTDVAATRWSAGFVSYCAQAGVVAGYDGKFDPAGQLTALQFGKMLLVELGYDAKAAGMVGADWAINTSKLMAKAKLMDGIDGSVNQVLTREKAAQMCLNALKTPTVEYATKGSNITVNGAEINFGASTPTYVTNTLAKYQTISKDKLTNSDEYTIELGEKLYTKLVLKDTTDAFGRPTRTWTFENKKVGEYVKDADLEYTAGTDYEVVYADLGLTKSAKITEYYVDGKTTTPAAASVTKNDDDHKFGANGVLTQVWYDDDNNTVIVTEINTYVGKISAVTKASGSDERSVTINGLTKPGTLNKYETESFEKSDLISYTAAYDKATGRYDVQSAAILEKSTTGLLTKWNGKAIVGTVGNSANNFTVDSETYKYSANFYVVDENGAASQIYNFDVNKADVDVYLDAYGYALYIAGVEGTKNYATVIGVGSTNPYGDRTTGVTLLLPDGTQKAVTAKLKTGSTLTGGNLVNNYIGDIVTYVEKNGVYELTVQDNYDTTAASIGTNATFTNGKSELKLGSTKYYATSETIFMVATKDGSDVAYNVYTGYANMPSIDTTKGITGFAVKTSNDYTNQVEVVYISAINLAGISDVDTYFVKKANADIITDSTGSYYVLPAIVDGEETTVKVDATITTAGLNNNANEVFVAANNVIKDKNDIITSFTDVKNSNTFSATKTASNSGYQTGTVAANRVVLGLNYTGNKNTATFWAYNDKTNVYVVDEKYKTITVSAVASVADDTNDMVYASADTNTKVLKDVIIIEVPQSTTPESGKFDPANPQKAYIDGYTVVIPTVDGVKVDNIANVLANNGYTVTGLMSGTVMANKNGVTYFFTENAAGTYEFWTIKVNGTVVEYVAKDGVSKLSNKDLYDKYNGNGTGFIWKSGSNAFAYAPYQNDATALLMPASYKNTAMVYETGYVAVSKKAGATFNADLADFANYVKVGSEVTLTTKDAVAANSTVTLNYTVGSKADKQDKSTGKDAAKLSFTIKADADVVLTGTTASTVYKVTANGVSTATSGLTATVDGPKMAKPGETVTFTVTLNGTVAGTSGQSLKVSASDITWLDTGAITGATRSGNELTLQSGTVVANATLQFSYTLSSSATVDATIDLSIGTPS